MPQSRLITVAIHTYDRALKLKADLEAEGIAVMLQNVNLEQPVVSSGVRVRIHEDDLPLALRIIENPHVFASSDKSSQESSHSILVPVDFTEYSFRALTTAIAAAAHLKADVCMLHSFIDPEEPGAMQLAPTLTYDFTDVALRAQLEEDARKEFDKFIRRATDMMKRGQLPPVKLSSKVVEGVPEDAIMEYASVNPPLLIVMGTRGAGKKERELVGSVTAEVLDACRYSTLAIPENAKPIRLADIRNVVFFTNLEQEDFLALDSMRRLHIPAGAHVTMIHVPGKKRILSLRAQDTDVKSVLEYTRKNLPEYEFSINPIEMSRMLDDVKELFDSLHVDLIVIPNKKKKNIFARLFNPSLAHKILFRTDTPVLAIPV